LNLLLTYYFTRPQSSYSETHVEFDKTSRVHSTPIDVAEREYRARFQPNYREEASTVDGATRRGPIYKETVRIDETLDTPRYPASFHKTSTVVDETTVDPPSAIRPVHHKDVTIIDETVEIRKVPSKHHHHTTKSSKMGYYDDEGKLHIHSFFFT
jgi:hypothetical protein